jgi:hypothetical protein
LRDAYCVYAGFRDSVLLTGEPPRANKCAKTDTPGDCAGRLIYECSFSSYLIPVWQSERAELQKRVQENCEWNQRIRRKTRFGTLDMRSRDGREPMAD